jgi:hypothetical protein
MRYIPIIAVSVAAVISLTQANNQYYAFEEETRLVHDFDNDVLALEGNLVGQSANDLFNRLKGQWGKTMISGQCGRYDDVKSLTGKSPAIQGFDFQNYSPHNPWHDDWSSWDDGTVQKAINWYKNTGGKGIVTF